MAEDKRIEVARLARAALALRRAMEESLRLDPGSVWKYAAYRTYVRRYNALVQSARRIVDLSAAPIDLYDESRIPGVGDTLVFEQKELYESVYANLSILASVLEGAAGVQDQETLALRDFVAANLRRAMRDPPASEVEVQDVLEHLLIGRGLAKGQDYDRETGRVKTSGKESVPDFVFPRISLAVEVKLSRDAAQVRRLVDEVNADIRAYAKTYATLVFVVYDLGAVRDEQEFRRDFESADGVYVIVVKH